MTKRPRYRSEENNSGSPLSGEPEFLAVGKLHKPHGLRGEMLMTVWTDFPERLQPGVQVFVGESHQPVHIRSLRAHNRASLIAFEGFDQRETAGQLRNQVVFVRTADLPPLPDDEIYRHQLLGLQVLREDDGTSLGRVAEILETGANNVLLIRREGKSDLLLPDIDSVVLKIDLEKGEIRVHLLPGLLSDEPV
jgi:16S rRNA processing protein RimM